MARNRPERRTDYRHYPDEYAELIRIFEKHGSSRMGPMTYSEALSVRQQFYVYRGMLRNAPKDDMYARELSLVAEQMVARPLQFASLDTPDPKSWFIEWTQNPIIRLVRGMKVTSGEAKDILTQPDDGPTLFEWRPPDT